jgi:hypothetical protein
MVRLKRYIRATFARVLLGEKGGGADTGWDCRRCLFLRPLMLPGTTLPGTLPGAGGAPMATTRWHTGSGNLDRLAGVEFGREAA